MRDEAILAGIQEVARMLGGVEVTSRAREHAREMLANQGPPPPPPKKGRAPQRRQG